MRINIEELSIKKTNLKKHIENYNNLELSYYSEINYLSNYWKDGYSMLFFENATKMKGKTNEFINSLEVLLDIYDFIVTKYHKLGNKSIEFDEQYSEKVLQKNSNLCKKIDEGKILYKSLLLDDNTILLNNIFNKHLRKLQKEENRLINIKNNIQKKASQINEIESKIGNMLSKVDFVNIKNEFSNNNIIKNVDNIIIDIDIMETVLKKIELYSREEDVFIDEFNSVFQDINYCYKSDNTKTLMNIQKNIQENLNEIINNHKMELSIIEKTINSYKSKLIDTKRSFEKLGDENV